MQSSTDFTAASENEKSKIENWDVVVIGGGQAGLAAGYYLRRARLSFVILDAQESPGGAWLHAWDSLTLFSPAQWSSLPGWPMAGGTPHYPSRDETISYLAQYEQRYVLPVLRPVRVTGVGQGHQSLVVSATSQGKHSEFRARAVISATGNWEHPVIPDYPGLDLYKGVQVHSAHYRSPGPFEGKRVLVVGGGNSGAQILAEVSRVADTSWVTLEPPRFMADDVDGRVLFDLATRRYLSRESEGLRATVTTSLGRIVMVPSVKDARLRGVLGNVRPFTRFTPTGVVWASGREERIDAVIWCTGFLPALDHLAPLGVLEPDGVVTVEGTRSTREPRLWLIGYGDWTGYASATLIGVGRTARTTVEQIKTELQS